MKNIHTSWTLNTQRASLIFYLEKREYMKTQLTALLLVVSTSVFANIDGAYLDPAYTDIKPPINDKLLFGGFQKGKDNKSDTLALIKNNTAVKSQASRGTCSVFSATAMLEAMLIIKKDFPADIDLSEQYLQYLITGTRTSDGSNSSRNFAAIVKHGVPFEATLPYDGRNWARNESLPIVQERCGHLSGDLKKSCYIGQRDPALLKLSDAILLDSTSKHYDPEFVKARNEAKRLKEENIEVTNSYWFGVYTTSEIKRKLDLGLPLTLGITVYYGAWNHPLANSYGIGMDSINWRQGIVGYPEPGSLDLKISKKHPAGHSVLIVGYDDEKVVTTKVKMEDGSIKEFTYKGVYYFKNSWGQNSFGSEFTFGDESFPGYGMITQKYANEMGGFFELPLE